LELKLRLPLEALNKFKELFKMIELDKQAMGIDTYGISLSTLDQVFIKVNNNELEAENKDKNMQEGNLSNNAKNVGDVEQKKLNPQNADKVDSIFDDSLVKVTSQGTLFKMHFKALTKKKWLHFKRDWKSVVCEIVVPMLCITLGLAFTLINWIRTSPVMVLGSNIGGSAAAPYNIFVGAQTPSDATSFWTNLATDSLINVNTETAATQTAFDTLLMNGISQVAEKNWFNLWADTLNTDTGGSIYRYTYTAWMNSTMPHSGNLAIG